MIALALDENKVIDVPDEEELDDDDNDDVDDDDDNDDVEDEGIDTSPTGKNGSNDSGAVIKLKGNKEKNDEMEVDVSPKATVAATPVLDDEKPSTSNGDASGEEIADVENDAVSTT